MKRSKERLKKIIRDTLIKESIKNGYGSTLVLDKYGIEYKKYFEE